MQLRCGNPGCKYQSRKHCEHVTAVASECKLQSALPDLSNSSKPDDVNEFMRMPEEPVESLTDRVAQLPMSVAAKEIMAKYSHPEALPADPETKVLTLMPVLRSGAVCPCSRLPYKAKPTELKQKADVFFDKARCTASVYAYDCQKDNRDCCVRYKGDEHGLVVLTDQTIVAEWLFFDCFYQVRRTQL